MNKSFKLLLIAFMVNYAGLCLSTGSTSMIKAKYFKASEKIGNIMVIRDKNGFSVMTNEGKYRVPSHDVDIFLNKMTDKQLETFIEKGCTIKVVQLENGDFKLMKHVPGLGGGPISGMIAYWVVKGGAVTVAVGAVGAAVGVTGGTALAPLAAGAATVATGGASLGVAAAGAALGASATAAPVLATGAAAAATAGFSAITAAAAGVETASLGAAALFTAIPFLP